jgi:hypothetical protein
MVSNRFVIGNFIIEEGYMPRSRSVIPSNAGKFNDYYKFFGQLVSQKTSGASPEWSHIPKAVADKVMEGYAGWYVVSALTLKPHTPEDTLNMNRAKEEGTALVASVLNEYIRYSSNVTEADRASLGIFAPKPHHRIEPPHTVPVLEPHAGTPGQVAVPYRDAGSARRGKPENVHGVEVRWAVLDHEPATREELIHSAFDTNSPLYLLFGEEDRGKRVYMFGCWEIEREGEKGPPGEIVSCFIP